MSWGGPHRIPPTDPRPPDHRLEWLVAQFQLVQAASREHGRSSRVRTRQHGRQPFLPPTHQTELWILAQAIGGVVDPAGQSRLEGLRREAVAALQASRAMQGPAKLTRHAVFVPHRTVQHWSDCPLPPEIHRDPAIMGATIPLRLCRSLQATHRQMVRVVTDVVARAGIG